MYLRDVAGKSFVLLWADWPVGKARQLIKALDPTHVIVHRTDPKDYYYLYTRAEAGILNYWPAEENIFRAFGLHESDATEALDAYANSETAKEHSVVLENGQVVGFFDIKMPPSGLPKKGGDIRRGETSETKAEERVHRSLVADFPEYVHLGETVSLLISLSVQSAAGAALGISLAKGSQVDVVVQPKRGFMLVEIGEGSLVVSDEEETLPLQFRLKATDPGQGKVLVLAFHQGQPLGLITLAPTVADTASSEAGQRRSSEQPLAPTSTHQPDLSLLILEHQSNGEPAITFRLTSPNPDLKLNLMKFGPIILRMDPLRYFRDFFKDIEGLPLTSPREMAVAEQRLAAKGSTLFETVFPSQLQAKLWELKDRIRSIQVQSEEPWIPWELCRLQGREDGRVVEGPFLCEAFEITRWLPEIGLKPTLTLKKMGLVVPKDSGLPFAANEKAYIESLANGGRKVDSIPASFLELTSALAKGEHDAWHFSGHGAFRAPDPNRSAIILENGEKLTPEDLSGKVENLGLTNPLVFLNACQIGRGAMSLTDIGGWAAKFLRAGAGAFIGSYWSVYDQAAYDFATAFYSQLLSGASLGKAVQEARLSIRPLGDPTWLAYTVFADPLARIA